MRLTELTLKELWHRKSQLISGLLAITPGIGVIVGIRSISVLIAVTGSLIPAYMAGKIEPFSNMQED